MNAFLVSIVSIIVGVIATISVSRYYFRRSTEKALTPYVQFSTSVFRGVEPTLRDALKISYKGVPVTDLLEIQFLIANTGFRPIRDVIEPLTLNIPSQCEVLDATLLHVHPKERDVRIEMSGTDVIFRFPLLNANEFFIAKLLLKGEVTPRDCSFHITADDLPPVLKVAFLPPALIDTGAKRQFEWGTLVAGLIASLIAAAFCGLIYGQLPLISSMWSIGTMEAFRQNWPMLLAIAIAAIPTLFLLVSAPMLVVGSFTDFSFPRRRRFPVPSDYLRHSFGLHRVHPLFMEPEGMANKPLQPDKRRAKDIRA